MIQVLIEGDLMVNRFSFFLSKYTIFDYFLYLKKQLILNLLIFSFLLPGLIGCGLATQTKGLTPIAPPISGVNPAKVTTVSSLKPYLKWELSPSFEKNYKSSPKIILSG